MSEPNFTKSRTQNGDKNRIYSSSLQKFKKMGSKLFKNLTMMHMSTQYNNRY